MACCKVMEEFLNPDHGCTPTIRDGFISACDEEFRMTDYEDDPKKKVNFCPWCGKKQA